MATTRRWSVQIFIDGHDGTTRAEARLETLTRRTSSVSARPVSTRTTSTCRRSATSWPLPEHCPSSVTACSSPPQTTSKGHPSPSPPRQVNEVRQPAPRWLANRTLPAGVCCQWSGWRERVANAAALKGPTALCLRYRPEARSQHAGAGYRPRRRRAGRVTQVGRDG